MNTLERPDRFHLEAAEGWLELGSPVEAERELEQINPALATQPAVLLVRCRVLGAARKWETLVEAANTLVTLAPELPAGWLDRSNALHFLGRYREAYDQLLPALERFPREGVFRYNLACFECRMGNLPAARGWLAKAFALDHPSNLRAQARDDPDLEPLWGELEGP